MFSQLNKLNMVDAAELKAYINRIVDDMDKAQLAAMEKAPLGYAAKIRDKIETLLEAHYRETFDKWLETERIVCMPSFRLPTSIHPASNTAIQRFSAGEAMLCLQIALSHFAAWRRNVLFRKISRAEVYRVHSIVLYFPMCFFRAGRKNFTVFTTLDFSTAFLLPSQSIYSEIKPKCRSASLIASTFSGGQG